MNDTDDKVNTASVTVVRPVRRQRVHRLLRWAEHLLAAIGLCFLVYHLCFEITVMTTDSMAPTLLGISYDNGDRILVEKITRRFRPPKRWEIYFFYNEEGTAVAKRVVGLPGEKVSIKNKCICINGVPIDLPARLKDRKYYPFGNLSAGREVDCGPGYYLLGDDSRDSYDSRFIGPIKRHQLRGRVWCILYPFSRFGFLPSS
jgi:signal peptidase I